MFQYIYIYHAPLTLSKSKFNLKPDRVNLVAQDTVPVQYIQTVTGKVDPARKFKCTTVSPSYVYHSPQKNNNISSVRVLQITGMHTERLIEDDVSSDSRV